MRLINAVNTQAASRAHDSAGARVWRPDQLIGFGDGGTRLPTFRRRFGLTLESCEAMAQCKCCRQESVVLFSNLRVGDQSTRMHRIKLALLIVFVFALIACLGWLITWAYFTGRFTTLGEDLALLKALANEENRRPFLAKTVQALSKPSPGTSGRMMRFKPTGDCLDSFIEDTGAVRRLQIRLISHCDGRLSQQWRINAYSQLMVGDWTLVQSGQPEYEECLKATKSRGGGPLPTNPCQHIFGLVVWLQVDARQIDVANRRVYFTIHAKSDSRKICLGMRREENDSIFIQANCNGSDDQHFYLPDVDYAKEFAQLLQQISQ